MSDFHTSNESNTDQAADWIPYVDYFLLCCVVLSLQMRGMGPFEQSAEVGGEGNSPVTGERVYYTQGENQFLYREEKDQPWREVTKSKLNKLLKKAKERGATPVLGVPSGLIEVSSSNDGKSSLILQGEEK